MSLARNILIRASRSRWLADQFRRRSFAKRAVRRFMPGEELSDALDAAATFATQGIGTVLTSLGERVATRGEAAAVREHYMGVFGMLRDRGLPTEVSVKLTHLGLDLDREACTQDVLALAARAEETGSVLWIDMEESTYVDATLDIYRQARAAHEKVGVAIQAYLHRTAADIESLIPIHPIIRLVKGAYREPPEVAFAKKRDTDANYLKIADRLLQAAGPGRTLPIFGTHDLTMIGQIRQRAQSLRVDPRHYEFHLLYGIKADEQRALVAQGATVKVLISYGSAWFPWYMRRLAERPANVWFVVKNMI